MANTETFEKQLEEAGEKMGRLMQKASDQEKERLRAMKKEIENFAIDEEKKGKFYDRSALFAAGIIANPDITDEAMKEAAKEYIEKDYLFIKSLKEEEEKH
ncbi:MAG: hypothetical protein RDV48_10500 [Candidatus Eremiobacteraeota bacterium]|nr:hypothetical protein [Candidatus Eremiobacteraeota bacterium]